MPSKDPRPSRDALAEDPAEETFIRTLVGLPGDDAPRVAYADWLDERSDPRGRWLRAELVWAAPWRTGRPPPGSPELQALALEFDAGWIARVSRPPLGVCCDHIKIQRRKVQLVGDDVDRAGARLGVEFPEQLRAFLCNYNGGRGKLNGYPHPRIGGVNCELQRWFSLIPDERPLSSANLLKRIANYQKGPRAYRSLIPLCAADAGYYEAFAIGCGSKNSGRVYHVYDFHLNDPPGKASQVARSLGDFLAAILIEVEPAVFYTDDD